MRDVTVRDLYAVVGGRLRLASLAPRHGEESPVGRIVIDSRQVQQGDVFWGLPGTHLDGTDFATEAYARGACGAVVGGKYVQPAPGCWSLEVPSALTALEQLAAWNRRRLSGRVVAVTGSVGKTTTRQMIGAVLGSQLCGSASPKNFNNHVGVPLSMLAMEPHHAFAVLELAASAAGEISRLARLARPHVGVITRIGDAHLGSFGSLEGVADAKAELVGSLPADGCAVLYGDDVRLRKAVSDVRRNGPSASRMLWFGRSLENDLVATSVECRAGQLRFAVDGQTFSVRAWGRHHLAGALAAVAVGRVFGLSDAEISGGLAEFQAAPMRCQIRSIGGATIIDDTYNASPVAMRAALELLRDFDAPGRRIVVCGDMRELGEASSQLHRTLGDEIVTVCGADLLIACGTHAGEVVAGACAAGMPRGQAVACQEPQDILTRREAAIRPGDVVLVKGSRAMAMEQLVEALELRETRCLLPR
jgi:UDP-N-acetylmuramoyl-tripeptide--D-alanyl-D-alanine ligase